MDRTVIDSWKAKEKELCEILYKKLQGITFLYPATDEFYKCFNEDMFLRPNNQAFFHVMHYLFRILDPVEFKKRFYWPITDKRSEANFRSSTVEYIKFLNEKYQLQWNYVKSYLFVSPGGMKFINFLLEFVAFVIQELTKQKEKQIGSINIELNAEQMRKRNKFLKHYASEYIKTLDAHSTKLHGKIDFLKVQMTILSEKIGNVSVENLLDDNFHKEFDSDNRSNFNQNFREKKQKIVAFENSILKLKTNIEKFVMLSKENANKVDIMAIKKALQRIQFFSIQQNDGSQNHTNFSLNIKREIPLNAMILTFNTIHPIIDTWFFKVEQQILSNEFVTSELKQILTEFTEVQQQMLNFQKSITTNTTNSINKFKTPIRCQTANSLYVITDFKQKLISTPPIQLDVLNENRITKTRLPLIDDFKSKTSFNLNYSVILNSARKPKISIQNANVTVNKSKIIDPMELLRTINKDSTSMKKTKVNSNNISINWKESRNLYKKIEFLSPTPTTNPNLTMPTISPFTPFSTTHEITRICSAQIQDLNSNYSTLGYVKKSAAVKKIEDGFFDCLNLNSSPTGRLDSLVLFNDKENFNTQVADTPKIDLNQINTPISNVSIDENDDKQLNLQQKRLEFEQIAAEEDGEEQLLNTSDGILNDVIM